MTATGTSNQRLTRFGIWVACVALVIYSPIGWTAGVVLPFVDLGLRKAGVDHFPLSMLLTYAFLVCALRLLIELWMRGYLLRR